MLEPYNTAFHSTVITMRPQLFSKFLQYLMLVFFLRPSQLSWKLVLKQLLLSIRPRLEDMGRVRFKSKGRIMRVNHPQISKQLMQFHHPKSVTRKILPYTRSREVLLLYWVLLFIELHDEVTMPLVCLKPACKFFPLFCLSRTAGVLLAEPLDCFPPLCLMQRVEVEPRRKYSAYLRSV